MIKQHCVFPPHTHPVSRGSGLEYIEEEVIAMLKGVDLDGNDSIEWKVGARHEVLTNTPCFTGSFEHAPFFSDADTVFMYKQQNPCSLH